MRKDFTTVRSPSWGAGELAEVAAFLAALEPKASACEADGYPCCHGLVLEDLLSHARTPSIRLLLEGLLEHSILAPLVPASVIGAAHAVFSGPLGELETALAKFLLAVGRGLGRCGPDSIRYVLLGLGPGSWAASAALRDAHDVAFDAFVEAAERDGLLQLDATLHAGLRDVAYDGLRAYLAAWMTDPGGKTPAAVRDVLAAALTDMLTSRTLRRIPSGLHVLEASLGRLGPAPDLRIPLTPFRLSRAVGFAKRVFLQSARDRDVPRGR